eukprot:6205972-Pleurochrysis_carterae.AAC.4
MVSLDLQLSNVPPEKMSAFASAALRTTKSTSDLAVRSKSMQSLRPTSHEFEHEATMESIHLRKARSSAIESIESLFSDEDDDDTGVTDSQMTRMRHSLGTNGDSRYLHRDLLASAGKGGFPDDLLLRRDAAGLPSQGLLGDRAYELFPPMSAGPFKRKPASEQSHPSVQLTQARARSAASSPRIPTATGDRSSQSPMMSSRTPTSMRKVTFADESSKLPSHRKSEPASAAAR